MKKCRIEVLKKTFDAELSQQYGAPGLGPCEALEVGDVFLADHRKPEGLCDEAWKAIYQYAFAIAHGSEPFYGGSWVPHPGVAICSCNDGLRPVIFKLEAVEV